MTAITIDSKTGTQLAGQGELVEIRDESGQILGHFVPALDEDVRRYAEPNISEEELRRREAAGGGRPLADILADLEKKA